MERILLEGTDSNASKIFQELNETNFTGMLFQELNGMYLLKRTDSNAFIDILGTKRNELYWKEQTVMLLVIFWELSGSNYTGRNRL